MKNNIECTKKLLSFNKFRRIAFTLAEVLITLGIIGVVAAMTIPTLINKYQKLIYVTQLHKVYTETLQALSQLKTNNSAISLTEAGLNSKAEIDTFFENYFKIVQTCDRMAEPCFANVYKGLNGAEAKSFSKAHKSFVIASGVAFRPAYGSTDIGPNSRILNLAVDINGIKGPNIAGRDLFWFYIYNDGSIDDYSSTNSTSPLTREERETSFNTLCNRQATPDGCLGKILNDDWQMKY